MSTNHFRLDDWCIPGFLAAQSSTNSNLTLWNCLPTRQNSGPVYCLKFNQCAWAPVTGPRTLCKGTDCILIFWCVLYFKSVWVYLFGILVEHELILWIESWIWTKHTYIVYIYIHNIYIYYIYAIIYHVDVMYTRVEIYAQDNMRKHKDTQGRRKTSLWNCVSCLGCAAPCKVGRVCTGKSRKGWTNEFYNAQI